MIYYYYLWFIIIYGLFLFDKDCVNKKNNKIF